MVQDSGRIAGVDVGDKRSQVCVIDGVDGGVLEETRIVSSEAGLRRYFARQPRMRVVLETGTHSPWMSRVLGGLDHEVIVANARHVRLVYAGRQKNDRLDAEKLARLARFDERLLHPVRHRGRQAQADLAVLRSRNALVRARTLLINHVRDTIKSFGARIPQCSTSVFHKRAPEHLPEALRPALAGVIASIAQLNAQIAVFDDSIDRLAERSYPETELLKQVHGVANLTSLAFLLTLERAGRFAGSRAVGAYLGLTPGQRQSGDRDPEQRISKQGDEDLRRLLVQSAHRILAKRAPDSDLRRHGQRITAGGGRTAKKRAVVAVARKLAVLLHSLWRSGEVYEPLRNTRREPTASVAS